MSQHDRIMFDYPLEKHLQQPINTLARTMGQKHNTDCESVHLGLPPRIGNRTERCKEVCPAATTMTSLGLGSAVDRARVGRKL
jgi:hypothetical protein